MADVGDRGLDVGRPHDPLAGDRVGEVRVWHVQEDVVAGFQEIDLSKRREIGGSVPGDRGRARDAGEVRFPVEARPADQVAGIGAVDHHIVGADTRDQYPPDGRTVAGMAFELTRQIADPGLLIRQARERAALDGCRRGTFYGTQVTAEMVLHDRRVQRRQRLLPDDRDQSVHQRQHTEHDQRDRQRSHHARRARAAVLRACERGYGRGGGERLRHRASIVAELTPCHRATRGLRMRADHGS